MCNVPVKPKEKISPRDIIKLSQIEITTAGGLYHIQIVVDGRVTIAEIADTNSMDGLMDIGHNALLLADFDKEALEVGDIIVYQTDFGKIIHRIVEKGIDISGVWYKCKGDNNFRKDPYIIRKPNILYLCIGIIY